MARRRRTTSSVIFSCNDPAQRQDGFAEAKIALGRSALVVMPTDTVYGVAADAFDPTGVRRLLRAKGRGRRMPTPVLIGSQRHVARAGHQRDARDPRAGPRVLARCTHLDLPPAAEPELGPRRQPRHRGAADARPPRRARPARRQRPARGQQRQPDRRAAGDHRRGGLRDARGVGRRLPRRRADSGQRRRRRSSTRPATSWSSSGRASSPWSSCAR